MFLAGLRKTLEKANQKKSERYKTFSFLNLKGDVRKPVLCIQPTFSDSLVFHIIPVVGDFISSLVYSLLTLFCFQVDEQCIKVVQLRPTKNNVRPASWMETIDQRKRKGISAGVLWIEAFDSYQRESYDLRCLSSLRCQGNGHFQIVPNTNVQRCHFGRYFTDNAPSDSDQSHPTVR